MPWRSASAGAATPYVIACFLWIEPSEAPGLFSWWLHLKPTGAEKALLLRVRGWGRNRADAFSSRGSGQFRPGSLGNTVNIVQGHDGRLRVALTRGVTEAYWEARAAYDPRMRVLGLDFGLKYLFASSEGDLVGRGFIDKIRPLARPADAEAARMQKLTRKPKESALYVELTRRLRAMIDCEVNRAINHLVQLHRPRVLAVEKLDFRGSKLDRRMNRLLTNCGRGAVAKKLAEFEARLGIVVHQVDPAYTSQTCFSCGYGASLSRKDQIFRCRFCGTPDARRCQRARDIAKAVSEQPVDDETDDWGGRSTLRSGATTSPTGRRQTRPDEDRRGRPRPRPGLDPAASRCAIWSGASTRAGLSYAPSPHGAGSVVAGRAPGRAPLIQDRSTPTGSASRFWCGGRRNRAGIPKRLRLQQLHNLPGMEHPQAPLRTRLLRKGRHVAASLTSRSSRLPLRIVGRSEVPARPGGQTSQAASASAHALEFKGRCD